MRWPVHIRSRAAFHNSTSTIPSTTTIGPPRRVLRQPSSACANYTGQTPSAFPSQCHHRSSSPPSFRDDIADLCRATSSRILVPAEATTPSKHHGP